MYGDLAKLGALWDRLAYEIDMVPNPAAVAALSAQLMKAIAMLGEQEKPTTSRVDEIAKKRARGRAAAGRADSAN
jgi:hypothetical protein